MSRFTLTAVLAIALLLIAATVVFAQGSPTGSMGGRGTMMQAPATTDGNTAGTTTTPGPMNGGQGHMGNGTGPMMDDADRQAMQDAMASGDVQAMQNTCQRIHDENSAQNTPQTAAPATAPTSSGV